MKLKTLKDIIKPHCKCDDLCRSCDDPYEELKAEAIKWVKKDIKDWNAPGGLFQSQIIKRWKERFNITEDDLK